MVTSGREVLEKGGMRASNWEKTQGGFSYTGSALFLNLSPGSIHILIVIIPETTYTFYPFFCMYHIFLQFKKRKEGCLGGSFG